MTMTNEALQAALVARVSAEVAPQLGVGGAPRVSPWRVLDFSSVFSMEWDADDGPCGVFIKVPKSQVLRQTVWPAVPADREMAMREFESLTLLAKAWTGVEGDVRFVEPLAFFPELSAVVTRRCDGVDVLGRFRVECRAVVPGSPLATGLGRLGRALRGFHEATATALPWNPATTQARLARIVADVETLGARVPSTPARWPHPGAPARLVQTLKGLDIRNVLIDPSGRFTLLDPGRLKADVPEADLGRLLVTCRLLQWGTLRFVTRTTPHADYERAVLEGYGRDGYDPARLRWYVAKELLKHWRAAYHAVAYKSWPRLLTWAVARAYIDPFFVQQLRGLQPALLAAPEEG